MTEDVWAEVDALEKLDQKLDQMLGRIEEIRQRLETLESSNYQLVKRKARRPRKSVELPEMFRTDIVPRSEIEFARAFLSTVCIPGNSENVVDFQLLIALDRLYHKEGPGVTQRGRPFTIRLLKSRVLAAGKDLGWNVGWGKDNQHGAHYTGLIVKTKFLERLGQIAN